MKNDPIVEEVRETRRKLMAKFGNDPEVYWKHLRRWHVQHSDSYLSVQDLAYNFTILSHSGSNSFKFFG